jgi:hypothetical protein
MGNCCVKTKGDSGNLEVFGPEAKPNPRHSETSISAATVEPNSDNPKAEVSAREPLRTDDTELKSCHAEERKDSLAELQPKFVLAEPNEIVSRLSDDVKEIRNQPFDFNLPPKATVELKGLVKVENGSYIGEWKDNKFEGRGRLYTDAGEVVEGYWHQGKLNGKGRSISKNGDFYEGDWVNGKKHGQGIYKLSASTYQGDWVDDRQTGHGKERWQDGSSYDGQYLNGTKHGFGLSRWPDGSSYEGDFVENLFEGQGIYKFADKNEYNGSWRAGKMHGNGMLGWSNGKVYEGEWVDDKKDGHGTLKYPDGKVYTGGWRMDKQHGQGVMRSSDGRSREVVCENGKMKKA